MMDMKNDGASTHKLKNKWFLWVTYIFETESSMAEE